MALTPQDIRRRKMRSLMAMSYAIARGSTSLSGAAALLKNDLTGMAIDFVNLGSLASDAYGSMVIKSFDAPQCNYSGAPFNLQGGPVAFSRTSNATVVDKDGKVKWAAHNLLLASEQFDNSNWAKSSITVAANAVTGPDGLTTTADTITASGANGTLLQTWTALAVPYTYGVWLRRKTGTGNIDIAADSGTWTTQTITSSWAYYTVSQTPAAGSKTAGIRIVTSGDEVYAWGAHLYRSDLGGMVANATPYPYYNSTTAKNLLGYTDALSTGWTATSVTKAASTEPNPFGLASSVDCTASGANGTVLASIALLASPYTFSIYLKRKTGTGDIQITVDGTTYVTVAVTGSWTRFSTTLTPSAGTKTPGFRIVTSGDAVYAYGAMLSDSASLDPFVQNSFAAPSASAYYGPRLDYDPVTLAPKGLLVEEARTNLATWSSRLDITHSLSVSSLSGTFTDGETVTATGGGSGTYIAALSSSTTFILKLGSGTFTGTLTGGTSGKTATIDSAATRWLPTNMTTAPTATGPGGDTNSATTLTATSTDATVLQSITSASAARITSTYIKRRTGTGGIELTQDNGTTWTAVTVTSDWTRVSIASATAANPTVGIRIKVSGDAVDVFNFQHEVGAFVTSAIPTTSASVTRSADVAQIGTAAFPYSATEGTHIAQASLYRVVTGSSISSVILGSSTTNRMMLYVSATGPGAARTWDGTNAPYTTNTVSVNTAFKVASAFTTGSLNVCLNGGTVASSTYSGGFASATSFVIGSADAGTGYFFNGHIRQITYLPRRATDAEIVQRSSP